jgi:diacylglycerol kinase
MERRTSLASSFRYAGEGLAFLVRTQRNARIELALGAVAVIAALWLGVSPPEWAVLALTIALVLILEGLNTALEMAVDLASPERNAVAKAAKDLSAGMVLIAALASVAVGAVIFLPRLVR